MKIHSPIVTGSLSVSPTLSVTGSIQGTSSLANTASSADNFIIRQSVTASNMLLTGTLVAQTINVQQVTSSIVYSSGSNRFGNQLTDVQEMTGSLRVTGSGAHYILGGNVGVGTTSPSDILDVRKNQNATTNFYFRNTDTTNASSRAYLNLIAGDTSLSLLAIHGIATYIAGTAGRDMYFQQSVGGTTNMFISSSGNVGIGTTTPSYKLHIRNDVAASTNLEPISLGLYNNSDGGAAIYFNNAVSGQSKISFGVESSGGGTDDTYLAFSTGQNTGLSERMRIDSSGRVLVSSLGYQPRFYAERATTNQTGYNATSTGDVVVIYNSAIENIGSHYSTSTGKFTAPVAGMYVFNYSAWVTGSAIGQIWLVVNGSRKAGTDMVYASSSVANEIISGMNTVYLAANDTVGVHPYNASATNASVAANTYHTWFKGYLIG